MTADPITDKMFYIDQNKMFFIDQNKKQLLITIGDSWTWGGSLGDLSFDYRSNHLYGKYLSNYLDSDWVNYGYSGGGNNDILFALDLILQNILDDYGFNLDKHRYNELAGRYWPSHQKFYSSVTDYPGVVDEIKKFVVPGAEHLKIDLPNLYKKNYQNIYIVVTLTETGRDTYSKNSKNQFTNIKDFLIDDETQIYNKLKNLNQRYKNINLVVGRNFSCDFTEVKNSICIEKNWVQINFEENQRQGFDNHNYTINNLLQPGAVSGIVFDQIKKLNYKDKKQYITSQIDNIDQLWKWLRNNPLNYNTATCHPTERSHQLWAEYLCQHLKKV